MRAVAGTDINTILTDVRAVLNPKAAQSCVYQKTGT